MKYKNNLRLLIRINIYYLTTSFIPLNLKFNSALIKKIKKIKLISYQW